jgi:hypothetical protein
MPLESPAEPRNVGTDAVSNRFALSGYGYRDFLCDETPEFL